MSLVNTLTPDIFRAAQKIITPHISDVLEKANQKRQGSQRACGFVEDHGIPVDLPTDDIVCLMQIIQHEVEMERLKIN